MKDVDYISGVSGGTYAATAFASHVVAAGSPGGENLDRWYLQIMARMSLGDASVVVLGGPAMVDDVSRRSKMS